MVKWYRNPAWLCDRTRSLIARRFHWGVNLGDPNFSVSEKENNVDFFFYNYSCCIRFLFIRLRNPNTFINLHCSLINHLLNFHISHFILWRPRGGLIWANHSGTIISWYKVYILLFILLFCFICLVIIISQPIFLYSGLVGGIDPVLIPRLGLI